MRGYLEVKYLYEINSITSSPCMEKHEQHEEHKENVQKCEHFIFAPQKIYGKVLCFMLHVTCYFMQERPMIRNEPWQKWLYSSIKVDSPAPASRSLDYIFC